MTNFQQNLTNIRWRKLSNIEQLANIGSEFLRAVYWLGKRKGEPLALWRVLELIDFSLVDSKWRSRLSELCRLREVICSVFLGKNEYGVSLDELKKYFLFFGLMHRRKMEKI